ncbi:MAG: ectoine/hydroxyectoine ABC transporter permease subunit EhuC [Rhizobiales bacterium]|nr:ectoine/hydroxyectoine ABC transporter permease subunit EhuC [Hyphomicrobiales bacterium]
MSYYEYLITYTPKLLSGAYVTLLQLICATALAMAMSLIFGIMRLSRSGLVNAGALIYIEFFRGTSLLVQLFWIYYVLPLFGVTLSSFVAGFVALGLNYGAYGAEILRGSIQAVPKAQWEATIALNMSPAQRMRRIIIPQSYPILLPPVANLMVELLKATALVAFISVLDLMFVAKQINATTWMSTQTFGTALVIYYIMVRLVLIPFLRRLELMAARKLGRT